jgi:hypothetical protein
MLRQLEKYYMQHIVGAGRHFDSQYFFSPDASITKVNTRRGFKIRVEVKAPDYVVEDIYEDAKEKIMRKAKKRLKQLIANPL